MTVHFKEDSSVQNLQGFSLVPEVQTSPNLQNPGTPHPHPDTLHLQLGMPPSAPPFEAHHTNSGLPLSSRHPHHTHTLVWYFTPIHWDTTPIQIHDTHPDSATTQTH